MSYILLPVLIMGVVWIGSLYGVLFISLLDSMMKSHIVVRVTTYGMFFLVSGIMAIATIGVLTAPPPAEKGPDRSFIIRMRVKEAKRDARAASSPIEAAKVAKLRRDEEIYRFLTK